MFSMDSEDIHIYNDYCIVNRRSIVHQYESQKYRDQGTYLTVGWRRREGMSNTAGRKWEMRYIYNKFNIFNPKNKENREKVWNHWRTQTKIWSQNIQHQ